jgi:site-specific recombinase XerD
MFNSDHGLVPVVVDAGFDPFRARVAMGGFLAGYSGKTFEAYALDLRQWSQWCLDHDLDLFEVRRAHIELFARWLEETGRAKSTVARRLSTITGFYRYCTEEQLIAHSPAAHVRRPRVSYESNQTPLDRNEVGMFLVQAGIAGGRDHALACLLALNGLRISEALGADIEHLGVVRGHRTLTVTRKGGAIVTVPLAPRTGRAIDLCIGERDTVRS